MILLLAAAFACARPTVHDGDSIRCGDRRVRLARIDAPELPGSPKCRRPGTDCDPVAAARSRDHLQALIAGRALQCRIVDASPAIPGFQSVDRYGRTVARCAVGGVDLSEAQRLADAARKWP